jgi:hypothetical protein
MKRTGNGSGEPAKKGRGVRLAAEGKVGAHRGRIGGS